MHFVSAIILIIFLFLGLLHFFSQKKSKKYYPAANFNRKILTVMGAALIIPGCFIFFILFLSFLNSFPKYIFYDTFKFAAPYDITELKGRKNLLENNEVWLKFRAGRQTASKILTEDFYEVVDTKHLPDSADFENFTDTYHARIFENYNNSYRESEHTNEWIAYEENSGEVFYYRKSYNYDN